MKIIVSVDKNWAIGYKGNLLQRVPEDMKQFKEKTWGKVVVMGRLTFESLPKKEPLPNRTNIILTRDKDYSVDNAIVCNSIEEVFKTTKFCNAEDIFIIGGEKIYKMFLPYCSKAYITKFHKEYPADTFFPNLDEDKNWRLIEKSEEKKYQDLSFEYNTYENSNKI